MQNTLFYSIPSGIIAISIIKAIIQSPTQALTILMVLGLSIAGPTFSQYRALRQIAGMDLGMLLAITNQSMLLDLYLHYTPNYDFNRKNTWGQNITDLTKQTNPPSPRCLLVIDTHRSSVRPQ